MEKHEEIINNASSVFDAFDMPAIIITLKKHQYKIFSQTRQIMNERKVEFEKNQLGNMKALKTTSRNVTTKLKLRVITKAKTFVKAIIKKFATYKL